MHTHYLTHQRKMVECCHCWRRRQRAQWIPHRHSNPHSSKWYAHCPHLCSSSAHFLLWMATLDPDLERNRGAKLIKSNEIEMKSTYQRFSWNGSANIASCDRKHALQWNGQRTSCSWQAFHSVQMHEYTMQCSCSRNSHCKRLERSKGHG